jgi:hypothetical protein
LRAFANLIGDLTANRMMDDEQQRTRQTDNDQQGGEEQLRS